MKSIKLFYFNHNQNWGDQYSPVICQMLSGCPIVHAQPGKCDMMAVGSILTRLKEVFFPSGFMSGALVLSNRSANTKPVTLYMPFAARRPPKSSLMLRPQPLAIPVCFVICFRPAVLLYCLYHFHNYCFEKADYFKC